jgi:hypothetical protein
MWGQQGLHEGVSLPDHLKIKLIFFTYMSYTVSSLLQSADMLNTFQLRILFQL